MRQPPVHFLLIGLIQLSLSGTALANKIPDFESQYYVNAFGIELGKATHRFNCQKPTDAKAESTPQNCTLISSAKPTGLAALLFKDSSIETIQLTQSDQALKWLSYHKLGLAYKDGKKTEKRTTLTLDESLGQVTSLEKQKQWPAQPYQYDAISIAYAIQYYKLNHQRPIQEIPFVLQEKNSQEKVHFTTLDKAEVIEFEFSDSLYESLKYVFSSQHSKIELWLLPNYDYFPSKIRITNKAEDRTITLTLAELPKRL